MSFRRATEADLETILTWAAAEGWNPGIDDAAAFHATDPDGFFVAEDGGAPVAAISVVNHSDTFAFLGLYICLPSHRGRGIGHGLWTHALTHAGDRTIGLDGVPDQQENYRKSGFVAAGATARYEGTFPADPGADLTPVAPGDIAELTRLDAEATGYEKPAFLSHLLRDTDTRQTLVARSGGRITGFATARACHSGTKIGPLVAEDMGTAATLLTGLAARVARAPFIIDIPDSQTALTEYAIAHGLSASFQTARMYRGPAPTLGPYIASAGTLELG